MRLVPLLFVVACSKDPVTAASYNAGLAVAFVDAAVERTEPTAAAIAGIDADVICLQEVWLPDQIAAVTTAAATAFPETYFMDPQIPADTGTPSCPDGEIDSLITCANTACPDVCDDELVDCVFDACGFQFLGLDDTCQECVMAEIGADPDVIQATCESKSPAYAYGSSFGIGILSKHPITSTEETVFDSTVNRRGAIHAVIEGPNGPFDFTCTHLSAVFGPTIPYPKPEGSWAEEQAVQIDALIAMSSAPANEFALVAGDMNAGAAFSGGVAEVPENYAKFTDAGWGDAYAEQSSPPCTFCSDNPLVGGEEGTSVILDHIFTPVAFDGTATPTRILDGVLETESCGEPITAAYSDHYGVAVTYQP